MMKWTLTIKDNETGEIVDEMETNAIMADVDVEDGSRTIMVTHCNIVDFCSTLFAAKRAVAQAEYSNPVAKGIVEMQIAKEGDAFIEKGDI